MSYTKNVFLVLPFVMPCIAFGFAVYGFSSSSSGVLFRRGRLVQPAVAVRRVFWQAEARQRLRALVAGYAGLRRSVALRGLPGGAARLLFAKYRVLRTRCVLCIYSQNFVFREPPRGTLLPHALALAAGASTNAEFLGRRSLPP